jgi:carbon storage regulator CsrA
MLVLSRRLYEKILFPNHDITVEVLQIRGGVVKMGITAPRHIQVLREELDNFAARKRESHSTHALNNKLNKLNLWLHLLEKQLELGNADEARALLHKLSALFGELEAPAAPGSCDSQPTPQVEPGGWRTLVVDDDNNERELLAGILHMNGCQCATAPDGQAALDYLASHETPDFVLLDLWMPRCDGRQTLRQIRRNPRWRDAKVFAISGASPQDCGIEDGTGGFDAWLCKPLNPAKLWDTMQKSRLGG